MGWLETLGKRLAVIEASHLLQIRIAKTTRDSSSSRPLVCGACQRRQFVSEFIQESACGSCRREGLEQELLALIRPLGHYLEHAMAPYLQARLPVDDLVQETFIRAWESLDAVRTESRQGLFVWLKRIAHRIVIDQIRRKSPVATPLTMDSAIVDGLSRSSWLTPSQQFSRGELQAAARWGLGRLEPVHQKVLQLRYFEGMTFVEIGVCLGQTSAAARGLHRTATRQLRDLIGRASWYLSGSSAEPAKEAGEPRLLQRA